MKKRLHILFVFFLLGTTAVVAQSNKKFSHRLTKYGTTYSVEPNFKEALTNLQLKHAMPLTDDSNRSLSDDGDSLVLSSIGVRKWNELISTGSRLSIHVSFSTEGKLYGLRFLINKEYLNILNDDDYHAIYQAFENYRIDMSKIRLVTFGKGGVRIKVPPEDYEQYYCTTNFVISAKK